ncbi:MAG: hypothetical protein Fur0037_15030 [Planctomycetota bacterium]
MHRSPLAPVLALPAALALLPGCRAPDRQPLPPIPAAAASEVAASDVAAAALDRDPILLRREILRRLDARIEAMATRAHLETRLALAEVLPIPYLGIDADPADPGMRVTRVYPGTAASEAGLAAGDVLVEIAGQRTRSHVDLGRAIRGRRPGETVALSLLRGGQRMTVEAVLGERPEEDEDEEEQFPTLPSGLPPLAKEPLECSFDGGLASPSGFESLLGGHGAMPSWRIESDERGGHLVQAAADPTGLRFPMLIAEGFHAADVAVRVRFRFAGGEIDRSAGVVLRFRDPGNYYVARANAAEGDLRIFRVAQGLRRTLPGGRVEGVSDDREWHVLEFRAEGSRLTATLDGRLEAEAFDSYFLQGRCGLWTKSDSRTEFDDLRLEPLTR